MSTCKLLVDEEQKTVIQLTKTGFRAFRINHSTCDSGIYYITVLDNPIFYRANHACYLILFFITLHLNASRQLCDNIVTSPVGCFQLIVNCARFQERRNKITILWQNIADFVIILTKVCLYTFLNIPSFYLG